MATTTPANASVSYKAEIATIARERLYPISVDETTLVIAPTDYSYPVGNVLRYGANPAGTSDSTTAVQNAIDVVYTQGGGDVFFPTGVYLVTSVGYVWTSKTTVNFRGEGKRASLIKKTGTTTTSILDLSSVILQTPAFSISDLGIVGNSGASVHDGLSLSDLANFTIERVRVTESNVGFNFAGALIGSVNDCEGGSNVTGYKSRSSTVSCNEIYINGGHFTFNSSHAFDIDNSSGLHLNNVSMENNGTSADTGTGAIIIGVSTGLISMDTCWFEDNLGMSLAVGNATGLYLKLSNCLFAGPENNNAINVGTIKNLILENVSAGTASYTITSAATRTLIIGGIIHTYIDNSTTTRINTSDSLGTTRAEFPNVIAKKLGGVCAEGDLSNIGQSGPFSFIATSSTGLARVGGYDYQAASKVPLNIFATMLQIPTATTSELLSISNVINTSDGKIAGSMVYNTTENMPMYATGTSNNSTWVGVKTSDGSSLTLTPV